MTSEIIVIEDLSIEPFGIYENITESCIFETIDFDGCVSIGCASIDEIKFNIQALEEYIQDYDKIIIEDIELDEDNSWNCYLNDEDETLLVLYIYNYEEDNRYTLL